MGWGDFPYVRPSVCPPSGPPRPEALPARSEAQPASQPSFRLQAWLAGPQARLDGPEGGTDGRTDKWKISPFYRTLSPIGAAALHPPCKPRKCHFKVKVKQGKGTADHLMPLGYLLELDLFKTCL